MQQKIHTTSGKRLLCAKLHKWQRNWEGIESFMGKRVKAESDIVKGTREVSVGVTHMY